MNRSSRITLALGATCATLLLAPTAAHADVTGIQTSCSGASGRAGSFVTSVFATVDGREIARTAPAGTWSLAWELEGDREVTLWDRTAGNDYDRDHGETSHGGPGSYVVGTFRVSCPAAPTTTVAATTTTVAQTTTTVAAPSTTVAQPTTTIELPATTDAPATTEVPASTDAPTTTAVPERNTQVQLTVPATVPVTEPITTMPVPVTQVELTIPPAPSSNVPTTALVEQSTAAVTYPHDVDDTLPATGAGGAGVLVRVAVSCLSLGALGLYAVRRRPSHIA